MFRASASRSLLRSLQTPAANSSSSPVQHQLRSQLCTAARRPQTLSIAKPLAPQTLALARWQSSGSFGDRGPMDTVNKKAEEKLAQKTLKATPETVSLESSTTPMVGGREGEEAQEDDHKMMAGVSQDMRTIRDTFSLQEVPRQAYYMGAAGVLPYLATSLSTVYCAWEINHASSAGVGFLMSGHTAELLLHAIEPLQVGYGAVIISFLGAIHWGLEWAKYGGQKGYPRYMIGVVSTACAWPTILLPAEYALISQFLIFNFLYYSDSRATKRGWAPPWYAVYRFVLTFVVGSAIVVSLIGRGQIADRIGRLPGPADRIRALRERQEQQLEEEEKVRRSYMAKEEEEEEE